METTLPLRHTRLTRLAHMGLALGVIVQLLTSLVFVPDAPGETANIYFEIHEYSGLASFGFALLFWLVVMSRKSGTTIGELFPWFSKSRLSTLWSDIRGSLGAIKQMKLPHIDETSAIAHTIHGLGLLLILTMALTGTVYYFINNGDPDAGGLVGVVMFFHMGLANVVWAYLIGHAGIALIHHVTSQLSLREMWSLKQQG